jgi:hypothetical protein
MPTFPAFPYTGSLEDSSDVNTWEISKYFDIDLDVTDFLSFSDYPTNSSATTYNQRLDFNSPSFFLPSNCLKASSFQLPKVTMPIIAIVGESNKAT